MEPVLQFLFLLYLMNEFTNIQSLFVYHFSKLNYLHKYFVFRKINFICLNI